jgi:Domain of unknown function (DUF4399)
MFPRAIVSVVALALYGCAAIAADAPIPPTPEPSSLVSASPAGAEVYFISPADGETVASPFVVRFGLKGMGVAPAGADLPDTGHHHILIDQTEVPNGTLPLPKTEQILHFGGGQTEASVTLAPGKHTLQLVLGNHLHVPHNPPVVSKVITVTVK